jgi:glycosyltransferase involved in cell wall biosynthesis
MTPPPRASRLAQTLAVAIVSYRRPQQLLACLAALTTQERLPDEVIIVIRADDTATHEALAARPADALAKHIVAMEVPGVVAARNAALAACRADIIAFCDDDTCAHPDWVAGILAHFAADAELGGLGGRDHCHDGERFDDRKSDTVGRMLWYGRTLGNHHLGHGAPREVHFLKGANMSFRMEATAGIYFDTRLRGRKIQAHEDFGFSMAVRRAGWKLLYDPAVALDHYAFRRDQLHRTYVASKSLSDAEDYFDQSYNYTLAISDELSPVRMAVFVLWSLLIGTRAHPGLLQTLRLTLSEGHAVWQKFYLCQRAIATVCAGLFTRPRQTRPLPLPAIGKPMIGKPAVAKPGVVKPGVTNQVASEQETH